MDEMYPPQEKERRDQEYEIMVKCLRCHTEMEKNWCFTYDRSCKHAICYSCIAKIKESSVQGKYPEKCPKEGCYNTTLYEPSEFAEYMKDPEAYNC